MPQKNTSRGASVAGWHSQLRRRAQRIPIFSEYINICKITEAKRLLEEENMKVYEAAEALGFESAFYFSKVFKRVEGVSPTEYVNGKFN